MAILDQFGKEIRQNNPIVNEIAGVETDIFRDYLGKIQGNPDKVIKSESGGKGIELFEDLLFDDKVGSTLQTRKLAVVGKEWEIHPASDDAQDMKIADYVEDVLLGFNYDAARKMLLTGVVLGYKPGEIMWERSEGDVWIKNIIGRSSRRFVFDLKNEMRMLTMSNMIEGEELPDKKFIIFRNVSDNGSPYGDGLGRILYWPVWFKKNGIKFWLIFSDKFGTPTAVGKYPPGTLPADQEKLMDTIDAIQQESAIVIPNTMVVELLEAARTGTVNTYKDLCNFMNGSIAQTMLGQTLTSDVGDTGSYAASKTHEEVRQDYIKADADALCEVQNNTLIKWLVDYNFPGVKKYPQVWIRTDEEKNLKPLAERDKILLNMGARITHKYIHDTYGIPQPEEDEELLKPVSDNVGASLVPAQDKGQEFAEGQVPDDQQAVDDLAGSLTAEQLQEQVNGVLKPVIDLINDGESFEDIQEKLLETYPEMNTDTVQDMLARAIFVSEAWGRINADS